MVDLIVHSARQLLTIAGEEPRRGSRQGDLGIVENGAVAITGDHIAAVGSNVEVLAQADTGTEMIDASNRVVLPGFVDAHTHLVFAGDRTDEFEKRLSGAGYLEIMEAGGGIMSTVRATRSAPLETIVSQSRERLDRMLAYGTTTAEAKTGYGLETDAELKLLNAISLLDDAQPVDLIPTFLGAHAVPSEYERRPDDYVDLVVNEMLPSVQDTKIGKRRLFCDVFCDRGAFSLDQSRRILTAAKRLGFGLKIHADEFANLGGAELAAELGATSADHLMVTRPDQMEMMARANVVAVLLPGTTFGLGHSDFADGRAFVRSNVAVALGSDLNPGTTWCESMQMVMAIAVRYGGLTPAEAIVASTLNAAFASGVGTQTGSLQPGKKADLLIAAVPDYRHLVYRYGTNLIKTVIKGGSVVHKCVE